MRGLIRGVKLCKRVGFRFEQVSLSDYERFFIYNIKIYFFFINDVFI